MSESDYQELVERVLQNVADGNTEEPGKYYDRD